VAMLPEDTSDVKVLGEMVPPKDTSGSVPRLRSPYSEWQESERSALLLVLRLSGDLGCDLGEGEAGFLLSVRFPIRAKEIHQPPLLH